jgi:aminoglycoside 3-N-acetyltransferase I
VAKGLISELKRIASERGAHAIFVQADPPDPFAVVLYESLGTRETI